MSLVSVVLKFGKNNIFIPSCQTKEEKKCLNKRLTGKRKERKGVKISERKEMGNEMDDMKRHKKSEKCIDPKSKSKNKRDKRA